MVSLKKLKIRHDKSLVDKITTQLQLEKTAEKVEKAEDLVNISSATSTPINCKSMTSVQNSTLKKRNNLEDLSPLM